MKSTVFAVILASLATSALAATSKPAAEGPEASALRAECAMKYSPKLDAQPKAANEYQFVYSKGEYKGEQLPGKVLACTESQYVAYLDKADPARVMAAYPTAAGRPSVKPAKAASK